MERVAEVARLAQDVATFPSGYETVVGERGTHETLRAKGGLYTALWRRQRVLEELEELPEAAE